MAVNADSVVVELEAKVADFNAKVAGAAAGVDKATATITKAAQAGEKSVETLGTGATAGFQKVGAAVKKAANDVSKSTGQAAFATRNLGFQIGDVGQQLGGGQSPFVIFAQQAPQFAQAFEDIKASGASLGVVLKSIALPGFIAVLSVLAPFVAKLFEGENATKNQKTALERLTQALADFQKQSGTATQAEYVRLTIMEKITAQLVAQEVQTRKNIKAQLDQEKAAAEAESKKSSSVVETGLGIGNGAFVSNQKVAALETKLKEQDRLIAEAGRAARVASGNLITANNALKADPNDAVAVSAARVAKANNDYAITVAALENKLRRGPGSVDSKGRRGIDQAEFERLQLQAQQRRDSIIHAEANANKGKTAERAAEAAARKAEADRVRDVRDNEAFSNDLAALNGQLIEARKSQADDAETLAQFERDRVAEEGRKRQAQIDADLSAKKYDQAQADRLTALNQQVVAERTKAIDLALEESKRRDALSAAQGELRNQQDILSAQGALATTTQDRKDVALRLLDLQYQQEKLDLEGIVASKTATDAQKQIAQARLDLLPALQELEKAGLERRNQGAGSAYLRSLSPTPGEKREMLDDKAIGWLQEFNSELDDSIKKSLHLHGIFGDIIGDLIDMAIKQALIKPLAGALFGQDGGGAAGGSGLLGKLAGSLGGLFGGGGGSFGGVSSDAFGGDFNFGGSGIVAGDSPFSLGDFGTYGFATGGSFDIGGKPGVDKNVLSLNGRPVARVSRGETAHIVPQAKRFSQGVGSAMRPQAAVTVISAPQFDLSRAVTTPDLLREVNRVSAANAQAAATAMGRSVLKAVPGRVQQYQNDER